MRQYSKESGLNYNSFKQWCYAWKRRTGYEPEGRSKPGHFVPVKVDHSGAGRAGMAAVKPGHPRFELKLLYGLIHVRIG